MIASPLQEVIDACKDWTNDTKAALKQRAHGDTGAGRKSIKGRLKVRSQEPYAISFTFNRYLVWVEKGAGKGAGGAKGSKWRNAKGELKSTNPLSKNKMGKLRDEQPWYDETIQERLPILNELIEKHLSDSIVKYIGLR
jgi:hypothetical protein